MGITIVLTPTHDNRERAVADGHEVVADDRHAAIGELVAALLILRRRPVTVDEIVITRPDGTEPLPYASGPLFARECPKITDPDLIDILSNLE